MTKIYRDMLLRFLVGPQKIHCGWLYVEHDVTYENNFPSYSLTAYNAISLQFQAEPYLSCIWSLLQYIICNIHFSLLNRKDDLQVHVHNIASFVHIKWTLVWFLGQTLVGTPPLLKKVNSNWWTFFPPLSLSLNSQYLSPSTIMHSWLHSFIVWSESKMWWCYDSLLFCSPLLCLVAQLCCREKQPHFSCPSTCFFHLIAYMTSTGANAWMRILCTRGFVRCINLSLISLSYFGCEYYRFFGIMVYSLLELLTPQNKDIWEDIFFLNKEKVQPNIA